MSNTMLTIDGAYGEGGGQILRSALTLAMLTGIPFRLVNIRAGRKRPGLRPQHLAAVAAATAICGGHCGGAAPGSTELTFIPGAVVPGSYRFDIATAGSASLVLQTVLLPLCRGGGPSEITVSGGTHVPWSPNFHYLAMHWAPHMARLGFPQELRLMRAGYYPQGGGLIEAFTAGQSRPQPLNLVEHGPLRSLRIVSLVSNLPLSIAQRQASALVQRLSFCGVEPHQQILQLPGRGRGTALLVLAQCAHSSLCCSALGARGKSAEQVADEVADELIALLAASGAVDPYLADQLLLPMALVPKTSRLSTARISRHLLTNAWLIGHFLPASISIDGTCGESGLVRVTGCAM